MVWTIQTLAEHVPADLLDVFLEEIEMAKELLPTMDRQALLRAL